MNVAAASSSCGNPWCSSSHTQQPARCRARRWVGADVPVMVIRISSAQPYFYE